MITVVGQGSINGVDLEHFSPALAEVRQAKRVRLGIASYATVFVFLGRLVRAKGVEELLQAFDVLRQAHDDVVLLLVGDQGRRWTPLSAAAVERLSAGAGVIQTRLAR